MARTQDSTKITFFANFLVFYDPDCTVLLVLLLLNHVELSVPLCVSNHVYFFIFFAHSYLCVVQVQVQVQITVTF